MNFMNLFVIWGSKGDSFARRGGRGGKKNSAER